MPETRDHSPLIRTAPPIEVKLAGAEADQGVIVGLASAFGGPPDSYGDVIAAGAYSATIAAHKAAGTMPVMAWAHDLARPIGRWDELREDAKGLWVRGTLNLETTAGREAFAHLKARDVGGLSIGFRVAPDGYQYRDDGVRVLTAVDLAEVSVVALPANSRARVSEVKSLGSRQELVDLLRTSGLPVAAAKAVAAGGWGALAGATDDEGAFAELALRMDAAALEIKQSR